jgi:hypothetical protein
MAEYVLDVDHGEEFSSQHGGKDNGAKSKHGDISIHLTMDRDIDLSMHVQLKNGNEMVVHIVYTLKLVEMN